MKERRKTQIGFELNRNRAVEITVPVLLGSESARFVLCAPIRYSRGCNCNGQQQVGFAYTRINVHSAGSRGEHQITPELCKCK